MPTADEAGAPSALLAEYLEQPAAAKALGISERTLKRWNAAGFGPPSLRLGHHRLYRLASLREWLLRRETSGGPVRRPRRGRK